MKKILTFIIIFALLSSCIVYAEPAPKLKYDLPQYSLPDFQLSAPSKMEVPKLPDFNKAQEELTKEGFGKNSYPNGIGDLTTPSGWGSNPKDVFVNEFGDLWQTQQLDKTTNMPSKQSLVDALNKNLSEHKTNMLSAEDIKKEVDSIKLEDKRTFIDGKGNDLFAGEDSGYVALFKTKASAFSTDLLNSVSPPSLYNTNMNRNAFMEGMTTDEYGNKINSDGHLIQDLIDIATGKKEPKGSGGFFNSIIEKYKSK